MTHSPGLPTEQLCTRTVPLVDGGTLDVDILQPGHRAAVGPAIIFVHGFRASKDWGPFPYICNRLAASGFIVLSFTFGPADRATHGGAAPGTILAKTIARDLRELATVVDQVRSGTLLGHTPTSLGLLGHSRGGGLALLLGSRRPDIDAIATWGTVSVFDRLTQRQKAMIRRNGAINMSSADRAGGISIGIDVLDDLEQNRIDYDLFAAVQRFARPLLVLHGDLDLVVRVEEAERLVQRAGRESAMLAIIPQANHYFGAVDPFAETTPQIEQAIEITTRFFHQTLTHAN